MRSLFLLGLLLAPLPAGAVHEQGASIVLETPSAEVLPGAEVRFSVQVRSASGLVLPNASAVSLAVTRTVRSVGGPQLYLQPKFQDLALAALTVESRTPTEVHALVRTPNVPDAVVTVSAVLDRGTPHERQATIDLVTTLTHSLPTTTPTPAIARARAAIVKVLPPPVVPERTATTTSITSSVLAVLTGLVSAVSFAFPTVVFGVQNAAALVAGIVTVRRRRTDWGQVVESATGRPVGHAVLFLTHVPEQKIRATVVAGENGEFAFAPPPGSYTIQVRAPGYAFPARRHLPPPRDPRARLYVGEPFTVTEKTLENPPQFLIPLDRTLGIVEEPPPHGVVNILQRLLWRLAPLFFIAGFGWNTLVLLWYPSTLHLSLEILYVLLSLLFLRVVFRRRRSYGRVVDATTRVAIPLALVRAYENLTNRLVQTVVTDRQGRYFLFLPVGTYTLTAEKRGYAGGEETIAITGGAGAAASLELPLQRAPTPAG